MLDFTPTSFAELPITLLQPVSTLSQVWNRLDDTRRELSAAMNALQSTLLTAGPRLTDNEKNLLSYAVTTLATQGRSLIQRQVEVSQAMNQVDAAKNLIRGYAPEVQRLYHDEQANYERNHELQEQLDELRSELRERGIVL
jgi:chromosome segregation ATPase